MLLRLCLYDPHPGEGGRGPAIVTRELPLHGLNKGNGLGDKGKRRRPPIAISKPPPEQGKATSFHRL